MNLPLTLVDGFHCILSNTDQTCAIIRAEAQVSSIPETVQQGHFSVQTIADTFLCRCVQYSIPIPRFITTITGMLRERRDHPDKHYYTTTTAIEIPASITLIENGAFHEFANLSQVIFSEHNCLRSIEGFTACNSLERIEIPSNVEKILGLWRCKSLRDVVFPPNSRVSEISGFSYCDALTHFHIPASVTSINGLSGCLSLQEVTFARNSRLTKIFERSV
jgi:hypothetical protein